MPVQLLGGAHDVRWRDDAVLCRVLSRQSGAERRGRTIRGANRSPRFTPNRNPAGDSALNFKYLSLATIGMATIFTVLTVLQAQESARRSVWDGVYTDQQAKRGEPKYRENCADCHGDDLEGDAEAPALSGATFQTNSQCLPLG